MPKTILIVDDSATIRQQVKMCLVGAGYHVLESDSGPAGLERANSNVVIDLVISDVNMPSMDGIEFIANLRKLPKYEKVPIFVLTTEFGTRMQEGKAAGATAWLVKPFKPDVLLAGIKKVLS